MVNSLTLSIGMDKCFAGLVVSESLGRDPRACELMIIGAGVAGGRIHRTGSFAIATAAEDQKP
jgi:hypothetical protein